MILELIQKYILIIIGLIIVVIWGSVIAYSSKTKKVTM